MARKRMIDPEFWLDEEVSSLSPMARLLYIGLWGICDDNHATLPNKPAWIRAQVFPYDESVDTRRLLDELSTIRKVVAFLGPDGKEYWHIKNFFKYQRVDRPSKPKYPEFARENEVIASTLDEHSTSPRPEAKLSKVKRREEKESSKVVTLPKKVPKTFIQGAQWNELIDLFEPVNPLYGDFYENKTERRALDGLARSIGIEKLTNTIKALPEIINKPFAPKVTKPTELKRDLGRLIAFRKQELSAGLSSKNGIA